MIATIKHFPGHGDTDVDSHLGLPVITFDRARLDGWSCVPFRIGIEQGAEAVMAAHIELPALDPTPSTPATFSRADARTTCCATSSDSAASSTPTRCRWTRWRRCCRPAKARCAPFSAGADHVLHSPDPIAAFDGREGGGGRGRISEARLDESVERVLRAKASVGLHVRRAIDLDAVPDERRRPRASGGRSGGVHPRRSRSSRTSAGRCRWPFRATRRPVSVGPRLPVRLADRRAEPHVHSRAEETLAAGDGDRGVGSHAAGGARSRPLHRARATAPSSCRSSFAHRPAAAGWTSRSRWCGCCGTSDARPRRPARRW